VITEVGINNFKCIRQSFFNFRPLTILTGTNSSGKSTVIQAILFTSSMYNQKNQSILKSVIKYLSLETIKNKYTNDDTVEVSFKYKDSEYARIMQPIGRLNVNAALGNDRNNEIELKYEETLFYLSANRNGQEELSNYNESVRVGENGQYILGYYQQKKDEVVINKLIKSNISFTLKEQVRWWLSHILGLELELKTNKVTDTMVTSYFNIGELENISPHNTGAGNSYLVKILIMCLTAKEGDVLIIENPEIHLHPKAQARLGSFLAFVANADIQLIVETHCEHLINRLRYEVYIRNIAADNVMIYYKNSVLEDFQQINIDSNGHYIDKNNNVIAFPSGFFDSTLKELLEIS